MATFELVADLARRQHGLASHAQLVDVGVPKSTITHWARTGRLRRMQPRVFAVDAVPRTWEQSLMAAVLATGGAACLRSAARLWGLWPDTDALEVLVPRGVNAKLGGVRVHWTTAPSETTVRNRIRTTTPPHTLVMLGSVASRIDVEEVAGRALVKRLVTIAGLEAALDRLGGEGVRGSRLLRAILTEWELGKRPPDSVLETRMATLLARFRLPNARFQHRVFVEGREVGRPDFAYPELRLAIEVDGNAFHVHPADVARNTKKRNALTAAGWCVIVFPWIEVMRQGADVAAQVRAQIQTCSAHANLLAPAL